MFRNSASETMPSPYHSAVFFTQSGTGSALAKFRENEINKIANIEIGMIPVPKGILEALGGELDGKDIDEIITLMFPMIKDTVLFIKGGYDLKRCIETLEDYMRASGMNSEHRVEGDMHTFLIQHDLGLKWSVFTEQLLTQVFRNFLPEKELTFQTTDNTVILSVSLGSDFNEHDYHN
ncbi:MAG: hypothetical protein ACW9XA_06120 [Candidatus Nitrosopumilus sp. bin_6a]